MPRSGLTLGLLGIAMAVSARVSAQSAIEAKVLIVGMAACCPDQAWPEAEHGVENELKTLGLDVEIRDGKAVDEAGQREELEALAVESRAAVGLRICKTPEGQGGAALWLADLVTGKTTYRQIAVVPGSGPDSAKILALRTVEAIRASLIEIHLSAPRDASPVQGSSMVPQKPGARPASAGSSKRPPALPEPLETLAALPEPEAPEPRVTLGLGPEALGSPGGTGAMMAMDLVLDAMIGHDFGLGFDALVTVLGRGIRDQGMASTFDLALFRVWGFWRIGTFGILAPSLGAGAGLAVPWAAGTKAGAFPGTTDALVASYLGAAARLGLGLHPHVGLTLGLRAGAVLPEVKVWFASQEAARFGLPLLEAYLSIDTRFY